MNKLSQNTIKHSGIGSTLGLILLILAVFATITIPVVSFADQNQIDQLNVQIDQKRDKLAEIEAEISKRRANLNATSGRANNLESAVKELEATKYKLQSDISYTETEIDKAELTLERLGLEINEKEYLIKRNSEALAESVRRSNILEEVSLIEKILGYDNISDFWEDFELTQRLQKKLHTEVASLLELHGELQDKEVEKIEEKNDLAQFKKELSGEKEAAQSTQDQKEVILAKTRNQEVEYQKLLNQKLAERDAFEKELLEIESQLNFLIDSDSYPIARKGILGWPLDSIIITQEFGGSAFAKTNPQIYGRPFHPGLDMGISMGSKVKSVYGGTVIGVGNTDAYPGCRSWGKWVVVEHDNGLTTLYAHLSSTLVSQGQRVEKGGVIALSGNSGISTGPHLHLSLYASQGVRVGRYSDFKSGTGCSATGASGPFADLDAYLDPMQYLPNL